MRLERNEQPPAAQFFERLDGHERVFAFVQLPDHAEAEPLTGPVPFCLRPLLGPEAALQGAGPVGDVPGEGAAADRVGHR